MPRTRALAHARLARAHRKYMYLCACIYIYIWAILLYSMYWRGDGQRRERAEREDHTTGVRAIKRA